MKEKVSLSEMTTLKVGGFAKYFFRAKTEKEIKEAVEFAALGKTSDFGSWAAVQIFS